MASGNPTLDAAEQDSGVQPLNSARGEPQAPQIRPARDATIPPSLAVLPQNSTALILPLSESSKLDTIQKVSTLPSSSGFEELIQAEVRPEGPSRAEEVSAEEWSKVAGGEYADLVKKVQQAAGGGNTKIYKVVVGKDKAEYYVAGLDADRERILAVRVTGFGA